MFTVPLAPKGAPAAGKMRAQDLLSDGIRRRFVLYLPDTYSHRALPLVLNLHGSTSYPEEQMALSGILDPADRHRVAVLAPEAVDREWNIPFSPARPDDVRFIRDALDATARTVHVDRNRLYATGFSGGGRMLSLLASKLALAAIAPVGGLRAPAKPPPSGPVRVVAFHGLDDPVNPHGGGGPPYWQSSVEDAAKAWAKHNGVSRSPRITRPSPSVTRIAYGVERQSVVEYRIEGLGHQWPGSCVDIGMQFGPTTSALGATDRMLEHFTDADY